MDVESRILRSPSPADFDPLLCEAHDSLSDCTLLSDSIKPELGSDSIEMFGTGYGSLSDASFPTPGATDSPVAPFDSPASPSSSKCSPLAFSQSNSPAAVPSTACKAPEATDFLVYRLAQLRCLATSAIDRQTADFISLNLHKMSVAAAAGLPVEMAVDPLVYQLVHQPAAVCDAQPTATATPACQPAPPKSPNKRPAPDSAPSPKRQRSSAPKSEAAAAPPLPTVAPSSVLPQTSMPMQAFDFTPLLLSSGNYGISPMAVGGYAAFAGPFLVNSTPAYAMYHPFGFSAPATYY